MESFICSDVANSNCHSNTVRVVLLCPLYQPEAGLSGHLPQISRHWWEFRYQPPHSTRTNMLSQGHDKRKFLKSRWEHSLLLLHLAANPEKTHRTTGWKRSSEKTQPNSLPYGRALRIQPVVGELILWEAVVFKFEKIFISSKQQ